MLNSACFFWLLHILIESLPISSSGHLSLGRARVRPGLEHLMHIPTFFIILFFVLMQWISRYGAHASLDDLVYLAFLVLLTNAITGICYGIRKYYPQVTIDVRLGFFITGVLLFAVSMMPAGQLTHIPLSASLLIGFAQGLALLPGISRMAATYAMGYFCGVEPWIAFMFSCAIFLPLIGAAVLKALVSEEDRNAFCALLTWPCLLAVMVSSFISLGLLYLSFHLFMYHLSFIYGVYLVCLSFFL